MEIIVTHYCFVRDVAAQIDPENVFLGRAGNCALTSFRAERVEGNETPSVELLLNCQFDHVKTVAE